MNLLELAPVWWILILPLLGFLLQAGFGQYIIDKAGAAKGKRILGTLAVLPIAGAFAIGFHQTWQLWQRGQASFKTENLFPWIDLVNLQIPFEVRVDTLSMTMVLIITGIGALIHLYATGYMAEEKDYPRFFTYLNLFVAMMLILVLGNNLVMLFIGWEGVGLCSYLLIGFWYKDLANSRAANKAFIVNRIGDWGLTLGMFMLVALMAANYDALPVASPKLLSYDTIFANAAFLFENNKLMATVVALLLFVGAAGKSAQFPLYLWLPDAMAGPTPVSALIHAATMVTAGVFLLNRMSIVFQYSQVASAVVVVIGAFTALFAAVIAFGQTDIKKVLAYSTVSQLGFMFIGCGAGAYWTGMFHVTTHAFFKALLFLGAGAVIHAMAHSQDMRNYGGLFKYLKITGATMVVGWIAIAGLAIPIGSGFGFAGFYSKESILGGALAGHHAIWNDVNLGVISGWVGLFVALLTAMYMTRLTWLTFFGKEERWRSIPATAHAHDHHDNGHDHDHDHAHHDHGPDIHGFYYTDDELLAEEKALAEHEGHHHELDEHHTPHEVPPSMWVPLVVLAICSIGSGYFLYQGHTFEQWLYPDGLAVLGEVHTHPEGLPIPLLWLSVIAAFGGLIAGLLVYRNGLPKNEGWDETKWRKWRLSARDQFGYDDLAVRASVDGGNDLGIVLWKAFDVRLLDGIVNGAAQTAGFFGTVFRRVQSGYARAYALMMLAGGVAFLGYIAYAMSQIGGAQ